MRTRTLCLVPLTLTALLAACAGPRTVAPPPVVATLVPPSPPAPAMPAGAYPGMAIPAKRADGGYATPNDHLTAAAAVWHLRGALNVAALACDRAGGPYVTAYNGWIRGRAAVLDAHNRRYTAEWQAGGGRDWRDAYDDGQTRLYNFYTQPAIHDAFCAVALDELNGVEAVPDADLPAHARTALARLDAPFTAFYAAFDRWRGHVAAVKSPPPTAVVAAVAAKSATSATPARPMPAPAAPVTVAMAVVAAPPPPWLAVAPDVLAAE